MLALEDAFVCVQVYLMKWLFYFDLDLYECVVCGCV